MNARIDCFDWFDREGMPDPTPTLDAIAEGWIAYQDTWPDNGPLDTPGRDETHDWAFSAVWHLTQDHPDLAMAFVEAVVGRTSEPRYLGPLVAGPLEDVLSGWPSVVDHVETLAADSELSRSGSRCRASGSCP